MALDVAAASDQLQTMQENLLGIPGDTKNLAPSIFQLNMLRREWPQSNDNDKDKDVSMCNTTSKDKGKQWEFTYPVYLKAVECNATKPKDFKCLVPKSTSVECYINWKLVHALLDSGSLSDLISTTVVNQLKLLAMHLVKPVACQMAATGSKTMITSSVDCEFTNQNVKENQRFDVINLENHDMIPGTPFLWQHKVILGFNPAKVAIDSDKSVALAGDEVAKVTSMAADVVQNELDKLHQQLCEEAADICKSAKETPLLPLRAINH